MIRIKICCIQSVEEAQLAVRHGVNLLGLVSEMPSGPGVIPEERITQIAATVPPGVTATLLTSQTNAASIIEQQRRTGVQAIQLVDRVSLTAYRTLREALPGIRLIQVIHVTSDAAIEEAESVTDKVDAILLDSGNPNAAEKILGGTGKVHDWAISQQIVHAVTVPVFLAGGLTPDNVAEAIRKVKPFGVDVCGGVRTNGKLDENKLAPFVHTARNAK
ncbi:phosphoribosylanthranilate isomerase [bacterium]|nr:phosphoribosylanthranilate isomerase [bacterium]